MLALHHLSFSAAAAEQRPTEEAFHFFGCSCCSNEKSGTPLQWELQEGELGHCLPEGPLEPVGPPDTGRKCCGCSSQKRE